MVSGNVAASPYIQNTTGGFNYVTQALNSFKNVVGGTQEQVESFYSALEQEGAGALANYIRTTDQARLSVQGFYNSLNLQTAGFSNVRNIIRQYNSITDATGQTQAAFANSVRQTNIGLASYITSVNAGKASMGGYVRSLISATVKTVALKVASVALNAAISMGVMFLISKGIQAVSDWATAEHDAAVAAKESAEETKQNIDSSEEYAQKVIELKEKLDSGNLSHTEAVETRKELLDLQNKLNDFYGDEIDNVNTLKDSYDQLNETQQQFVAQEANKWMSDNADSIEKAQTAYEHFGNVDYFDTLANDIQKLKNGTASIEEYNEIVSRYEKELASNSSKFKKWNGEYADNLQDVLAQQENLAHDLQEYIYDRATDPNWFEKLGNLYTIYGSSRKKQYGFNYGNSRELLEIYNQYGEMLAKSKYGDILAQITAQQNKLNEALANEDTEGIKQAREELAKLSKTVKDYQVIVSEDNAARLYLSNLIGDSFSEDELQKSLKEAYNNAFANLYNTYANGEWTHDQKLTRDITAGIRDLSIDELTTLSNANISQIKAYGKDVNEAIKKALQENKQPFNWAEFYNEQGLEDIEKKLKSLKTAYKSLEEDGALSKDEEASLLKEYPELLQYIDDPDRLKVAIQSSARDALSAAQLVLSNLYLSAKAGSIEEQNLRNALQILEDMADVTTKVKEEKEKATKVSDLYKDQKLQIHENITALEREVKTIDKQISALEKKKDLQEKYIKTLEKEKDRLEDLIDDYETAASTVKDYIDEQNDALEKQKDNIEDTYKAQIKAIEETYEKQVKLLEAQEEGFDKQIKALQDEADEQDRLNNLKEKELALEKAKNEKVRVYDESRGWIVTENSEEVSKKRKELEEAQRENKIAELEKEKERLESEKERLQAEKEQRISELESIRDKEIEALQAEMDKLKEYKTAWEEAIAAYKKAQDEMTTAAILGADWRTKLAEQDKTIIEDYKNGYEGVQNQLNNSVIPMIELANKELDTYSEQIDKLKEQKDLYKDMEDNQKKYLDFYKTYAEQFADATKEQSDAVEALNKALATNTLLTNMDNTDKAWDWAKSLFDEDYIREYPDYNGGKTASSVGLIGRLTDIFNKSTSVYDSFVKSIPNLLNKTSSDLSGQVIAGAKLIADSVTNNKSNVDNSTHTININNPGFAMTMAEFVPLFTKVMSDLAHESQIGKK